MLVWVSWCRHCCIEKWCWCAHCTLTIYILRIFESLNVLFPWNNCIHDNKYQVNVHHQILHGSHFFPVFILKRKFLFLFSFTRSPYLYLYLFYACVCVCLSVCRDGCKATFSISRLVEFFAVLCSVNEGLWIVINNTHVCKCETQFALNAGTHQNLWPLYK